MDYWNLNYLVHANIAYAAKTVNFVISDTEEDWLMHMKNPVYRERLEKAGFATPDAIEYKFNNQGFRTAEFDTFTNDYFIALGCSFTFGTALRYEDIWPTKVSNITGLEVCNLGVTGAAIDTAYRMLRLTLTNLPTLPKFILLYVPPLPRFEILNFSMSNSTVLYPYDVKGNSRLQEYFLEEANLYMNRERNIHAIQYLGSSVGVPVYIKYSDAWEQDDNDVARDFAHQGPLAHTKLAKSYVDDFNLTRFRKS